MRTGFAQRSLTYSAPHIWNSLPHVITDNLDVTANTFKKKLKTFYHTNCYPQSYVTSAPAIRHLMTDVRRVKRCIIIIIIIISDDAVGSVSPALVGVVGHLQTYSVVNSGQNF